MSERRCSECEAQALACSPLCIRHLRSLAVVSLDRRRWPRLKLCGRVIAGHEQWRPRLRQAGGEEFVAFFGMLSVNAAEVIWR